MIDADFKKELEILRVALLRRFERQGYVSKQEMELLVPKGRQDKILSMLSQKGLPIVEKIVGREGRKGSLSLFLRALKQIILSPLSERTYGTKNLTSTKNWNLGN